MTYRGNRRPARPRATPLTRHQQEMLLPIVRGLAAAGRTDPQIAAYLAANGPLAATSYQVQRIRYKAGICWARPKPQNPPERPSRAAVQMVPGIRELFLEPIRELAREDRSDRQIAEALSEAYNLTITRYQVYFLRREYDIDPGCCGPALAQKRRAAAAGQPEPTVLSAPHASLRPVDQRAQLRRLVEGWVAGQLTDQQIADRLNEAGIATLSRAPGGWSGRKVEALRRREGLRSQSGRGRFTTAFQLERGYDAHCCVCDAPVDFDSDGRAILHKRLTSMVVAMTYRVGRCEGSGDPVVARPIPKREQVMAA